ncbi:MAG: GTPase ObgE, partial [Pseudomonadota bacterium]
GLEDKPRLVALNKLDLADSELGKAFADELIAAGAAQVFTVSGASGEGVDALLDAVLSYLPDRTATETKTVEVEDEQEEGSGEWSPI